MGWEADIFNESPGSPLDQASLGIPRAEDQAFFFKDASRNTPSTHLSACPWRKTNFPFSPLITILVNGNRHASAPGALLNSFHPRQPSEAGPVFDPISLAEAGQGG